MQISYIAVWAAIALVLLVPAEQKFQDNFIGYTQSVASRIKNDCEVTLVCKTHSRIDCGAIEFGETFFVSHMTNKVFVACDTNTNLADHIVCFDLTRRTRLCGGHAF